MTIYTTNVNEKKEDENFIPQSIKTPPVFVKPADLAVVRTRRNRATWQVCIALILLPLGLCFLTGCIWLYKRINERTFFEEPRYIGKCGVNFHQYSHFDPSFPRTGFFEAGLKITSRYERFSFPHFGNITSSITLHLFDKRLTVIVDKVHNVCFIHPLDDSHVIKTDNFWEVLKEIDQMKLHADLKLEEYDIVGAPLTPEEKKAKGGYVESYCGDMETYNVRPPKRGRKAKAYPRKRSACQLKGLKYCEAATLKHNLYCFKISQCL